MIHSNPVKKKQRKKYMWNLLDESFIYVAK